MSDAVSRITSASKLRRSINQADANPMRRWPGPGCHRNGLLIFPEVDVLIIDPILGHLVGFS